MWPLSELDFITNKCDWMTMAAMRAKHQQPVGSAGWVLDERQQAIEMIDQEMEGFAFSARNEMEWLNEHMADIFSRTEL